MKIALCLKGITGASKKNGVGEPTNINICAKHYYKHLINQNNTDVFFHTWSTEKEKELVKLYNPKSYICENQMTFGFQFGSENFRSHSNWYSTQKSIKLKNDYETQNNIKYDFVFVSRFDLLLFTNIIFENYNNKNFYVSHWNDSYTPGITKKANKKNHSIQKKGFLDLWFFSNSEIMNNFGNLYDNLKNYSSNPHISSWQHAHKFLNKNNIKYTLYRYFDFELFKRVSKEYIDYRWNNHNIKSMLFI